jgi:hypothetical protein
MTNTLRTFATRFGKFLAIALTCASLAQIPVHADSGPPREIDAKALISELGNALAQARVDTGNHLSRLGFSTQVNELQKVDSVPIYSFSSETIIKGLYQRAEAHRVGEGARFLAVLYRDQASRSAAIASDPDFSSLRKYSPEDVDIKRHPIVFAPLDTVNRLSTRPELPPTIESAIGKLAKHYSGHGIARARAVVLRNFGKPGFNGRSFEKALAESKTSNDVWRRLIDLCNGQVFSDIEIG